MFDINQDLNGRPFLQQLEILWISGPTWHNADKISKIVNLPKEKVLELTKNFK